MTDAPTDLRASLTGAAIATGLLVAGTIVFVVAVRIRPQPMPIEAVVAPPSTDDAEREILAAGGSVLLYGEGWQCVMSVGGTQYRANGATEEEAKRNAIEAWRVAR